MLDDERTPEEESKEQEADAGGDVAEPAAEAPEQEPPAEETPPAEEPPAAEAPEQEPPAEETPPAEEPPAAEETPPAAEEEPPATEEPAAEETPPAEGGLSPEAASELEPTEEEVAEERTQETGEALKEAAEAERRPRGKRSERGPRDVKADRPADVIPGEHLEPDLVLEEERAAREQAEFPKYDETAAETPAAAGEEPAPQPAAEPGAAEPEEAPRTAVDLAADARYRATGKRKTSVARVILRPGTGAYSINGRPLDEYFPRPTLQRAARQPLETAGYEANMDVVANIHGGGVSSQAGALRHGVARALIEADPALRTELKRHGFLTRDARAKERKKAGLKKARKRPQFSKR